MQILQFLLHMFWGSVLCGVFHVEGFYYYMPPTLNPTGCQLANEHSNCASNYFSTFLLPVNCWANWEKIGDYLIPNATPPGLMWKKPNLSKIRAEQGGINMHKQTRACSWNDQARAESSQALMLALGTGCSQHIALAAPHQLEGEGQSQTFHCCCSTPQEGSRIINIFTTLNFMAVLALSSSSNTIICVIIMLVGVKLLLQIENDMVIKNLLRSHLLLSQSLVYRNFWITRRCYICLHCSREFNEILDLKLWPYCSVPVWPHCVFHCGPRPSIHISLK